MDDLNKKFNLPMNPENNSRAIGPLTVDNEYEYARKNIIDNIERSLDAISDLADLAKSAQHPRAYEVLNQMLKTVNEMNRDLLDIKKQEEKSANDQDRPKEGVTINQLTLTTSQLLEIVNKSKDS